VHRSRRRLPAPVAAGALALLTVLTAAAFAADPAPPKTLLAQPDKLLFADDLSSTFDSKNWKAPKGKWEIADGALRGAEIPADKHGAVTRHMMKMQDFVASFEVKLDGAKTISFTVNAVKDHMSRIILSPTMFRVQRDDNDHEGPDKAVVFLTKPVKIEPGTWHTVVMEMVGDTLVGTLDGETTGKGSNALFKQEKVAPGFTVAGQSASFRNLRIWSAKAK
jgi:hypothetical protein